MVAIGRGAASGLAFIPEAYNPSASDVKIVGAAGIMGVLGYGLGFLGSLALAAFALYAFQSGKPRDRSGSYYRSRMPLYIFGLGLVGLAQLLLGSFVLARFGRGPLPNGPIGVAMFIVNFPEISLFVGLLQILIAVFGATKFCGVQTSPNNHRYQAALLVGWAATVGLQIMVQVAYTPADMAAAAAPSVTMLTMGIYVINGFLDYKAWTTPDQIPLDYYHVDDDFNENGDDDDDDDDDDENNKDEEVDDTAREQEQV
jgi:hypothetical protein